MNDLDIRGWKPLRLIWGATEVRFMVVESHQGMDWPQLSKHKTCCSLYIYIKKKKHISSGVAADSNIMFFMIKRDKLNKGLLKVYENKVVKKQVWIQKLGLLPVPDSRWFRDSRFKYVVLKPSTWTGPGWHRVYQPVIFGRSLLSLLATGGGSGQTWGTHGASLGPPKMSHDSYHLDHLEQYSNPKKDKKSIGKVVTCCFHMCFFARWPVWSKADQRSDGQDPCRLLDGMG